MPDVPNVDASLTSADWLKGRTWDVRRISDFKLVETADEMLRHLGVHDRPLVEQQEALARFLALPAAKAMPPELRGQLAGRGLI